MNTATDLPIEQQELILRSTVFATTALKTIAFVRQIDISSLEKEVAKIVDEEINKLTEKEIKQWVKKFFEANINQNQKPPV